MRQEAGCNDSQPGASPREERHADASNRKGPGGDQEEGLRSVDGTQDGAEVWTVGYVVDSEREKAIAFLNMLENRSESHASQPPSLHHSGRQKDGGSI